MFGLKFSQWRLGGGRNKIAILGGGAPATSGYRSVPFTLTTAQIDTLNATPITLVTAPGAGRIHRPIGVIMDFTKNAVAWSANPTFQIIYETDTTNLCGVTGSLTSGAAVNTFGWGSAASQTFGGGGFDPRNRALQIRASVDTNPGAGTCTIKGTLLYFTGVSIP